MTHTGWRACAFFLMFFLSACSSAKKDVIAPQMTVHYTASALLNPDINARPSPLVVILYQLKSDSTFKNATFFQIYNDPTASLGNVLLSQQQIEIKPQQQLTMYADIAPQTHFIAWLAAYRDIKHAQWQKIMKVDNTKALKVNVFLDSNTFNIQLGK